MVIDIADRAARDPDTVVTVDDLRAFERRHGRIPAQRRRPHVLRLGAKVGDADAYRGADAAGTLHFPGFGPRPASGCCAAGGSAASGSTP